MNARRPQNPKPGSTRPARPLRATGANNQEHEQNPKTRISRGSIQLLVIAAAALIAFIAIFTPLRSWLEQHNDATTLAKELVQMQEKNDSLRKELALWEDPDYVAAQARKRIGYVRKGEIQFLVLDPPELEPEKSGENKVLDHTKFPWFQQIAQAAKILAQDGSREEKKAEPEA